MVEFPHPDQAEATESTTRQVLGGEAQTGTDRDVEDDRRTEPLQPGRSGTGADRGVTFPTPGTEPAARSPTQRGANGGRAETPQDPRGSSGAGRDTAPAARQNAEELTAGTPHPDTDWERVRADGERWMTAAARARSPDEDMQADEATGNTDMGFLGIL